MPLRGNKHQAPGWSPTKENSISLGCRLCASINACNIGNCLRLYCRWSYMISICVDGPALEDFYAIESINVWLSDSELPSIHVTLTLLFERLTVLFGWEKIHLQINVSCFSFITLQMPQLRPLQSRATTIYCWTNRSISLVAHWQALIQCTWLYLMEELFLMVLWHGHIYYLYTYILLISSSLLN